MRYRIIGITYFRTIYCPWEWFWLKDCLDGSESKYMSEKHSKQATIHLLHRTSRKTAFERVWTDMYSVVTHLRLGWNVAPLKSGPILNEKSGAGSTSKSNFVHMIWESRLWWFRKSRMTRELIEPWKISSAAGAKHEYCSSSLQSEGDARVSWFKSSSMLPLNLHNNPIDEHVRTTLQSSLQLGC